MILLSVSLSAWRTLFVSKRLSISRNVFQFVDESFKLSTMTSRNRSRAAVLTIIYAVLHVITGFIHKQEQYQKQETSYIYCFSHRL